MQKYVETALEWQRARNAIPFVILERRLDTVIGSTRFENIDMGARAEAILRWRMVQHDGSFRDAVYFSVLDDEWPEVKLGLEIRLGKSY